MVSFQRAVSNLLDNAVHALEERMETETVHRLDPNSFPFTCKVCLSSARSGARAASLPLDFIVLTVMDTGRSIRPSQISTLGTYGATTKKNGNGLGLYSIHHWLKSIGGRMEFTPRIGSPAHGLGSRVQIFIPYRLFTHKRVAE